MHAIFLKCLRQRYGPGTVSDHIERIAEELDMSPGAVKKWIYRSRLPRYATMKRIEKITKGSMGLKDW